MGQQRRLLQGWSRQALILAASLQLSSVKGQFGGGGYNPPAPICPPFSCPAGQKAVGTLDHQIWSYGCKDSGMNFLSMASFDPNNPLGGMNQGKNVDKCCVERDICKQTCGMTSKACHDNFQKCSQKICKGDQNCNLAAMMSEIMSEPYDAEDTAKADKYDPEATKCKGYNRGQGEACRCVPDADWKGATESKLKSFYQKFNPEKLNTKGEIKEVDEVFKKWKGKEPDMFMALATKYKAKAVEIRQKPKPPPYSKKSDTQAGESGDTADRGTQEPKVEEAAETEDAAALEFERQHQELEAKKSKAAADEDYDAAEQAKKEAEELLGAERERLNALKVEAIEKEDYKGAKKIKQRLARLSEL